MQVNAVALLPDGETFVSAAREVLFGNLKDGTRRDALQPRPGLFRAVAVSPDGRRLAAGGADGVITIWDLVSKQEVATFPAHNRPLMALKFLSDGDTLMSLSVDEIRVWSAAALPEADRSL